MRSMKFLLPLLVAAACTESPTAPAADQEGADIMSATASVHSGAVDTVMRNLNAPRGMAWLPGGGLFVVEAGEASAAGPCATVLRGQNCYSGTGSISRLWKGQQERIVTGLPSAYNAAFLDIIGPQDIGFDPLRRMQITIGWGGPPDARAQLGAAGAAFGTLIEMRHGTWSIIADLAAVENTNPAGGPVDSNPFGMFAALGQTYVVDAGGNSLLRVRGGAPPTVLATFPSQPVPPGFPPNFTQAEAVPTEVARGPDGALYVSTLTGAPFVPGAARIFRVVPGSAPTVHAGGFTMITDIAWGHDRSLYVLQYASQPFFGGVGSVIRVKPDGTRQQIITGLTNPTSIAVTPDGALYIANRGNVAGVGEVIRVRL